METGNRAVPAALLVLGAMALFGLIDNFMRLAAASGGLWQFHFLRAIVALAVLLPLATLLGVSLRPASPRSVALRSVLNASAMVVYFGCLGLLPIAQAVAGLFTAPLFVVVFSVLLFGDRIGARRVFAVLLGFAGIVLALRPASGDLTLLSVLPVLAGAFYGLGNLITRRLCGQEGTLTLLGGFFGMMMLFGALGCALLWLWPLPVVPGAAGFITRGWMPVKGVFAVMIVVQGLGSLLGVGMIIRAYQMADATSVAVLENALLVFATLWAVILWGEWPDAMALLGLALIVAAGVIIARHGDRPVTAPA